MIKRASGLGMGVGRFSRPLRVVAVQLMPDAGLDTRRRGESLCEVAPGAGVPGVVVVGVCIARRSVADVVEVTRSVISAKR